MFFRYHFLTCNKYDYDWIWSQSYKNKIDVIFIIINKNVLEQFQNYYYASHEWNVLWCSRNFRISIHVSVGTVIIVHFVTGLIITPIYFLPDDKNEIKKNRGRLYEQTTCPKCGKLYTTRKSMMRHYRFQCTNARQFKCSVCIYRCNRKDNLRSHMHLQHKLRLL